MTLDFEFKVTLPKRQPKFARSSSDVAWALTAWQGRMLNGIAKYPGQMPTKSGYIRTGQLGRGWRMKPVGMKGGSMVASVVNSTAYAAYVQGDRQTREMARRRWPTVGDVAKREAGRLTSDLRSALVQRA